MNSPTIKNAVYRRLRIALAGVVLLLGAIFFSAALTSGLHAQASSDGSSAKGPTVDTATVLVQLRGEPLSTYAATKPAQGKKIDFSSDTVKSYRARLSALRNDFKQWLQANAPKAQITGKFDIALNAVAVQLNGTPKSTVEKAPQAMRVEYQGLYYPTDVNDPDLNLIHAIDAWSTNGGPSHAGEGVKVAIVDTGIDVTHPCFSDLGYPTQTQLGDHHYTNNKVIVAKVFNNKAVGRGYTAQAIQEHGTHVSGTVGCDLDTQASVDGVAIPYGVSGVAPKVLLGNYNIFPGDVANARSEDILNALEAAYADGFDIANMSLGGDSHGIQDLLTVGIDDLDQAGFISAVAAGNSGPGHFTVESPGSAARALTAGASSVGHFIGAPVTVNSQTYGTAAGDFATVQSDLTAPLGAVLDASNNLAVACSALPAGSLTGQIALISRGTCTFSAKIRNAQDAGAVAALIVNNAVGAPSAMAQDGTANQPTIPAYMAGLSDKADLVLAAATHASATIGAALTYIYNPANDNFMAGFSSQGPTDVDFRIKPDVVAPGVSVLSSIPLAACGSGAASCWAFFQGTSMATPHLAGSAAVVLGQHPSWSAAQVRSAIVNTADEGVLKKSTAPVAVQSDVNVIGSGRDNLLSAVNASVALDPVSVSFGAVPSGSGQTKTVSVSLTNLGTGSRTFALSVTPATGTGVTYSVSPASISLAGGASGTVTVTMSAAQGASGGGHQAKLSIANGSEVAHAVVFTYMK